MTCTLLTRRFPPRFAGGSGVYLHNVFSRFPPGEVTVFTAALGRGSKAVDIPSVAYIRRSYVVSGTPPHLAKLLKLRMLVCWTVELLARCVCCRPDCVYIGQIPLIGLQGLLTRCLLGIPYVAFAYGEELTTLGPRGARRRLATLVCRHASKVLTVSGFTASELRKLGVGAESIVIAPPGVDTTRFSPLVDARELRRKLLVDSHKVILTVGRLTRRKGHAQVLAALPHVMRYVPELRYVIVGPDAECGSALRETVRALKLGDHVRFTGQVDPVDLPRYYSLCDVFVMANLETEDTRDTEGFGIVFLEASASGKPVIGGRAGGAAEAVKDGVTGLLVDSLDTLSLAQSMTRLLTDDTLARRLGAQGREWVMRNFDWDQTAEKVREAGLTVAAGREEGVQ